MHTSTDSYWNSLESVNKDSSILVVPADSMKNAVISDSIRVVRRRCSRRGGRRPAAGLDVVPLLCAHARKSPWHRLGQYPRTLSLPGFISICTHAL